MLILSSKIIVVFFSSECNIFAYVYYVYEAQLFAGKYRGV